MRLTIFCVFFFSAASPACTQSLTNAEFQQAWRAYQARKADTTGVDITLRVAHHYIAKPGEYASDLDSAIILLQESEKTSRKLHYRHGECYSLYLLAQANREKGLKNESRTYALKGIRLAEQHREFRLMGECYMELLGYYDFWQEDELAKRVEILQHADTAFARSGNKERHAFALKNLADHYQYNGDFQLAIRILKRALKLQEEVGEQKRHGIYDLLGYCYASMSDYENALRYGLMAERWADIVQDTTAQMVTIFFRIGGTYVKLKDDDKAMSYYLRALEVARKYKVNDNLYMVAGSLVMCYLRKNKPQVALSFLEDLQRSYPVSSDIELNVQSFFMHIYLKLNDLDRAAKLEKQMMKSPENIIRIKDTSYIMQPLIDYYLASRQLKKAKEWIDYYEDYYRRYPEVKQTILQASLLRKFKLDSLRGNFGAALKHYQLYKNLQDSLLNVNKTNQLLALQIEFESEQKDKDIQLKAQSIDLLTKQAELREQHLQQSRKMRNAILAGIVVLLVFLAILFRQYKAKRTVNVQLLKQRADIEQKNIALRGLVQEKQWLLQEIHHRVKNNLQTILNLLGTHSRHLSNDALAAIQESQNRVQAMSLIHQKLYQSDDIAAIDMKDYLSDLVENLINSFSYSKATLRLDVESMKLDVSQAVPIGLIVNEALTNSMKYAFQDYSERNSITISLQRKDASIAELCIADNGIGFQQTPVRANGTHGLGLKLIRGMATDIEGEVEIATNAGFRIVITFEPVMPLRTIPMAEPALV